MLELLDWRPDSTVWRQEWMHLHEQAPCGGWRDPSSAWLAWARTLLCQSPPARDDAGVIARILRVAEAIHPQGIDRQHLGDALLALGRCHGRDYQPADARVEFAERNGVIRMERIDLWRPGMASGTGWRTYCRLTLYGKSLVETDAMPEPFPPPETTAADGQTPRPFSRQWFEQTRVGQSPAPAASPTPPIPPGAPAEPSSPAATACSIPHDFSWTAAFVDQEVRKFFRKHWDAYTRAIQAVINDQMRMEQFALDFGPARISTWINTQHRIPADHPNPCSRQNINTAATYEMLIKAFKRNPQEHAVVQRLQQGRSAEAQAILDAFLGTGGSES